MQHSGQNRTVALAAEYQYSTEKGRAEWLIFIKVLHEKGKLDFWKRLPVTEKALRHSSFIGAKE